MGTPTQTKDPVKFGPVVLITDPYYMWPGAAGGVSPRVPVCTIPSVIAIVLDPSAPCPSPDAEVFVFNGGNGTPIAWVTDPSPRLLGSIVDTQRLDVADACRQLGNGLRGVVRGMPSGTNIAVVKVVTNAE